MTDELIQKIESEAKSYFKSSAGSHGWDHVQRVYNLAVHIAKKEQANIRVVRISSLLHDISRDLQDSKKGTICHAEHGAIRAREILKRYDLPKKDIDNIVHSIAAHRFRKNVVPKTIEAMILRDADKLDSIGAIGIGRSFMFAGEAGSKLHNKEISMLPVIDRSYTDDDTAYQEYLYKLSKIKDLMHTKEGARIAEKRHTFMEQFFETLNQEVDGIR
jgi:uncharacterized protein